MTFRACLLLALAVPLPCFAQGEPVRTFEIASPEHDYWNRPLHDPFTRFLADLDEQSVNLDRRSEKAFLVSLLTALDVPVSSQLLLFSKTSLQLGLISPRNPRAIYYNEQLSVGYIPGGKIEIASIDPALGATFHIFDIPRGHQELTATRSRRCMNCHVDAETHNVPGFVIKSVIPGPNGGSLDGFRIGETGHQVPLRERFGGYYLTGVSDRMVGHHNRVGRFVNGEIVTERIAFGDLFDQERYPAPGSDLLSHLVHEHQAGFTNRVIAASYLARSLRAEGAGTIRSKDFHLLDRAAKELTRYLLFADEAALPVEGIGRGGDFRAAFLSRRRADSSGRSLRDLHLRGRLFEYRCSYMIYSPAFQAMPSEIIKRVYRALGQALSPNGAGISAHLPASEKAAIHAILNETLPGWHGR